MKKNQALIVFIVIFLVGIGLGFQISKSMIKENKDTAIDEVVSNQEETKEETSSTQKEEKKQFKEVHFLDSDAVYSASEEIFKEGKIISREDERVILDGFDFAFLESLGIGKDRLEKGLRTWCDANGYSSVAGATFYPRIEMNVMEECITFEVFLHYSKEGNGSIDESKRHLSLKYFYIKNEFIFY